MKSTRPIAASLLVWAFILGCPAWAAESDPWIDTGYQKRLLITNLSPADPASPLRDFPVLISLTNAAWLDNLMADGGDITFAGVGGKQLFHEVEQFDHASKSLVAWVCVPSFTNKTAIYMYWRNSGATKAFSASNTALSLALAPATLATPAIASNVWDANFIAVYHLANTTGRPRDSTRYTNDSDQIGVHLSSNAAGIGGSRGYFSTCAPSSAVNGIRIRTVNLNASVRSMITNSNSLTMSLWFKHMTWPSNASYMGTNVVYGGPVSNTNMEAVLAAFQQASSAGSTDGKGVLSYTPANQLQSYFITRGSTGNVGRLTNLNNVFNSHPEPYSNWSYYSLSGGGDAGKLFLQYNDVTTNFFTGTFPPTNAIADLYIFGGLTGGAGPFTARNSPWGWGDEFRYSLITRPSNWIVTEYSNTLLATNMGRDNGAAPPSMAFLTYTAITNVGSLVAQGAPFRGYVSPAGMASARLMITNASLAQVYNQPVTPTSAWDWSASPSLPTGTYTAVLSCTNADGAPTNSAQLAFTVVIASTLTVRSADSTGVPWPSGRVVGPSPSSNPADGTRTNNANGEAIWLGQYSSAAIALTNFTPVAWGGAFLVTNFVMPETSLTIHWIFDAAAILSNASNAFSRLDPVAFAPSQAPFLRLSIPAASNAAIRVVIAATPLAGGRRVTLFDGSASPADPSIRIPSETLKKYLSAGTWLLEYTYPKLGSDRSKLDQTRRLLFYLQ
ncbi:MAG: DUF2341 domain-containing protein [Spirochaetes bacterium]|nr:DUF2341 domain-containing protein [Spirochaetota bacterium]